MIDCFTVNLFCDLDANGDVYRVRLQNGPPRDFAVDAEMLAVAFTRNVPFQRGDVPAEPHLTPEQEAQLDVWVLREQAQRGGH